MGLEPTTFSLATRRSTTELRPHINLTLKLKAFYKLSNRLFVKNYPDYHIYNLDALTYAGNLENLIDVDELPNYFFEHVDIIDKVLDDLGASKIDNLIILNKVDLLIIDAEGYDGNIVIDLLENSNILPIIIFEYIHIKFDIFDHLIKLLKNKKYSYFKINENLICFPNKINIKSNLNIY